MMFLFHAFLVFTSFLQACSVFFVRFDDQNLPYLLKNNESDDGLFEAASCDLMDVLEMVGEYRGELSQMTSFYKLKGIDVVLIMENFKPGRDFVRLPVGAELYDGQFDDIAATASMIMGLNEYSFKSIIGKSKNLSPMSHAPFFFAGDETLPRVSGIVNVDHVTCYVTTVLQCFYQIPVFRERIHKYAKDQPSTTVNLVSLVDKVFTNMSKGTVPDEKLMRSLVNTLAKEHRRMLNKEGKITIEEAYDAIEFFLTSLHKCLTRNTFVESPFDELFRVRSVEDVNSDNPTGFSIYDPDFYVVNDTLNLDAYIHAQLGNVEHLPPYLFISMPRFFGVRIETLVDFPLDNWTIAGPYMNPMVPYTYDLAAIVIHVRSKVAKNNGGHYVIAVKQAEHWVYLNDAKQPIRFDFEAEKKLLQREGNIFMYKRQGAEISDVHAHADTENLPLGRIVLRAPEDDVFPKEYLDPNYEFPIMEVVEKKKLEVKKPEVKKPEVKKPELRIEEKKPEVKKPELMIEVKKPEVKRPELKIEVKKPEVKAEVKVEEKQPSRPIKAIKIDHDAVKEERMRQEAERAEEAERRMIKRAERAERKKRNQQKENLHDSPPMNQLVAVGEGKFEEDRSGELVAKTLDIAQTITENAVHIAGLIFLTAAAGYFFREQM